MPPRVQRLRCGGLRQQRRPAGSGVCEAPQGAQALRCSRASTAIPKEAANGISHGCNPFRGFYLVSVRAASLRGGLRGPLRASVDVADKFK